MNAETQISAERCNRCRFWLADEKTADSNDPEYAFGRCRVAPPVIIQPVVPMLMPKPVYGDQIDPDISTYTLMDATKHPVTHSRDWCGNFVPMAVETKVQRAFAEMRAAYKELHDSPEMDDAPLQPLHDRIQAAQVALRDTAAEGYLDVACKLRMILAGIDQGGEETMILYRLQDGSPAGDDVGVGFFDAALYSLILELEGGR